MAATATTKTTAAATTTATTKTTAAAAAAEEEAAVTTTTTAIKMIAYSLSTLSIALVPKFVKHFVSLSHANEVSIFQ